MRLRIVLVCVAGLALGLSAAAQTKISGTNHCAKPDPQTMVEVGDRPNHAFSVGQVKCAWTKPWKLAGIPGKEGVGTFSGEVEATSPASMPTMWTQWRMATKRIIATKELPC